MTKPIVIMMLVIAGGSHIGVALGRLCYLSRQNWLSVAMIIIGAVLLAIAWALR